MTQGERIRELRKSLGLTLEKFGEKIGMKKNSVSQLENGKNSVTEQVFKSICREFNANYSWLVSGEGEMFSELDSSIMAKIDYIMTGEPTTAQKLFKAFAKLDEEDWKVVEKIIDSLTP